MSIKNCQAIQKNFIDRISNAWFMLGSESETMVCDNWNFFRLTTEQNIFLFEIARQVDIPKEAVGLVLESVEVTSSETIPLTEEVFEGLVNLFRKARGLCIDGDDNGVDLVTEEADCFDDDINKTVLSVLTLSHCLLHELPKEEVSVHRRG